MKMRSVLFAAVAAVAVGTTAKAEVKARVWMLDHADPNTDELVELKNENPDAYALVKALLMKKSLGLLDPKHPTASFSKPAPHSDDGDHAVGAAVYEKFATTDKEKQALEASAVPYDTAEMSAVAPSESSGNKDWLNWKPADSAANDDAMVKNVLGSVAGLMGSKPAPSAPSAGSLDADEASILAADDVPAKAVSAPVVEAPKNFLAKPVEEAPTSTENSYLKGLDLGSDAPADSPQARASVSESPVEPIAAVATSARSPLDGFSFDDSNSNTDVAATTAAPKVEKATKSSALGSWLGMVKPHVDVAPKSAASAAPAQDSNPYLTDLS